jgi:hypothetical protein
MACCDPNGMLGHRVRLVDSGLISTLNLIRMAPVQQMRQWNGKTAALCAT